MGVTQRAPMSPPMCTCSLLLQRHVSILQGNQMAQCQPTAWMLQFLLQLWGAQLKAGCLALNSTFTPGEDTLAASQADMSNGH